MRDVSEGGGGGGGGSSEKRPYDVSRGQNRCVTLPLTCNAGKVEKILRLNDCCFHTIGRGRKIYCFTDPNHAVKLKPSYMQAVMLNISNQ